MQISMKVFGDVESTFIGGGAEETRSFHGGGYLIFSQ